MQDPNVEDREKVKEELKTRLRRGAYFFRQIVKDNYESKFFKANWER